MSFMAERARAKGTVLVTDASHVVMVFHPHEVESCGTYSLACAALRSATTFCAVGRSATSLP